jgi:DNA-binding LacI/PurR family transcriptional regulator
MHTSGEDTASGAVQTEALQYDKVAGVKVKETASGPPPRTLDDLAKLLGVSRATVSNAFNRPDQLSAKLRERILATAKEAGYAGPDPTARALSRGERGAVGLVFTEQLSYAFSDPAAVHILEGIARACEQAETGLLLVPVSSDGDGSAIRAINAAAVDALALYSLPDDDPAVEAALGRGIPTVMIDQPLLPGVPYVGHDDRSAARLALGHLLEIGHRRIGVLGYRLTPQRHRGELDRRQQLAAGYRHTRTRLKGYEDALRTFDSSWDSLCFFESESNDPAGGAATTLELLRLDDPPTAILTDSDQLAIGALQAATESGLQVPSDLSVIGMDDVPAAAVVTPSLTTIRQPLVLKGEAAGRILLGERSGKRKTVFPVDLVARESTAPPPRQRRPTP